MAEEKKNDVLKKKLRVELQFKKNLSPKDLVLRPHLYKLNGMSLEAMKENLSTILGDSICKFKLPLFPQSESFKILLISTFPF